MTGEEKQQIYLLRKKGISFADIADKLNISKNTVKTFCWRNGLSDAELEKLHVITSYSIHYTKLYEKIKSIGKCLKKYKF